MPSSPISNLLHLSLYQASDGSLSVYFRGETVGDDFKPMIYLAPLDEHALRRLEHAVGDALATALLTAQERCPF